MFVDFIYHRNTLPPCIPPYKQTRIRHNRHYLNYSFLPFILIPAEKNKHTTLRGHWENRQLFTTIFAGHFFSSAQKIFDTLSKGFTIWLILFAALFILKYSPYWGYSGSVYGFFHTLNRHSLLAIIGSMMVLSFFQKGIPQRISYYLSFIGKNSLEVYILHLLFAIQIPLIGAFWLSTNPITCITTQIVFAFFAGGIAISLSLVSAWVLKRSKFLSMILFGK